MSELKGKRVNILRMPCAFCDHIVMDYQGYDSKEKAFMFVCPECGWNYLLDFRFFEDSDTEENKEEG